MALDAQWSAVARGYRLALVLAGLVGVAALAVCALTGYPFAGFFITVGLVDSPGYPKKLAEDQEPPAVLFWRGSTEALERPAWMARPSTTSSIGEAPAPSSRRSVMGSENGRFVRPLCANAASPRPAAKCGI